MAYLFTFLGGLASGVFVTGKTEKLLLVAGLAGAVYLAVKK